MEYLYFKLYEDSNLYCITFWILCYAVIISFTLPLRLWSIQSVRDIHGQKTKFEARTEESLVTTFCEPDFQLENNPASDWPEIWPTIYRDWKASGMLLGRNLESRDSLTSCHILCPSPVNTLSRLAASPVNTLSWLAAPGSHRHLVDTLLACYMNLNTVTSANLNIIYCCLQVKGKANLFYTS